MRCPTVRAPVVLLTLTNVAKGGVSALLTTSNSPSLASYASSSARRPGAPPVDTSATVLPLLRLIETTRLLASVANSHGNAATTPLGPEVALLPVKPLYAGLALTWEIRRLVLASTTSTPAFDRTARYYFCRV